MSKQDTEIRARYLMKDQVFEFAGMADSNAFIPEAAINSVIDSMLKNDGIKGQTEAEIMRFLVAEAKKRAQTLTAQGERDGEKYWVGATNKPASPGQALVGPGGES